MRAYWIFILALFCAIFSSSAHADVATHMQTARQMQLAQSPLWLNLLQYDTTRRTPQSDVRQGDFFLSETGHADPEAELAAFIAAALQPIPENANDHATCRFPARLRFVIMHLGDLDLPRPDCTDYTAWTGGGPITDATLIYASGSLGEPATFYGHILLKFTSNATFSTPDLIRPVGGSLLDTSLNYGAVVPDDENGAVYILNGLFGGYTSRYTNVEYYEQRGNYVQSQDRDLWEYNLTLTDPQLQLLVESSWELYQAENTYYFLSKNCAYRFAELIAMVTGQDIAFNGKPWSMPIDVFVELMDQTNRDGTPLVTSVARVKAPSTMFLAAYNDLNADQQAALEAVVRSTLNKDTGYQPPTYLSRTDITDTDRTKVIEAGLLYVAMIRARTEGEADDDIRKLNQVFLLQRLSLPAGATDLGRDTGVTPPHEGHRSSLAQITYLSNSRAGNGIELRLRPVFTDFLSLNAGGNPFSEMSMGDTRLILRDGQVSLQGLDLLRITAISTRDTNLPYEYKPSWRIRFGAESESLSKDRNIVAFAEYGYGHATKLTDNGVAYVMAEGRLDSGPRQAQLGVRAGGVARINDALQFSLSSAFNAPVDAGDETRIQSDFALRIGSSPLQDFRLIARHEDDSTLGRSTEIGFSYSRHF